MLSQELFLEIPHRSGHTLLQPPAQLPLSARRRQIWTNWVPIPSDKCSEVIRAQHASDHPSSHSSYHVSGIPCPMMLSYTDQKSHDVLFTNKLPAKSADWGKQTSCGRSRAAFEVRFWAESRSDSFRHFFTELRSDFPNSNQL